MRWIALVLLAVGCGSTQTDQPKATPTDPRLAELQTSMTELLERLDVMNDRISRLEQAQESGGQAILPVPQPPAASSAKGQTGLSVLHSAQIADTYRNGIVLYGKNRAAEARAAFQQVFDADPAGDLADNALFWIGETYFGAGDHANAMRFYRRVADEYAEQNKAPDALFKLALAQEKTGDLVLARTTLQEVITRYPYSTPAGSAKAELQRIKY